MLLLILQIAAVPTPSPTLTFDGIVDAYVAVGATPLPGRSRSWLTQPRTDRAFDLNLAALGVTWLNDRSRARLAIQSGSSVVANYSAESDPGSVRYLEEAYVGIRPGTDLWVDAGIFSSAIGLESWRSTENPAYTRSLSADYTPYYSAGLRLIWKRGAAWTVRADLVNGWQRIGENNDAKAVALRVDWNPRGTLLLGGSAFAGNEKDADLDPEIRRFGQIYGRIGAADRTTLWLTTDLGTEGVSTFGSATAILRRPVAPNAALTLRAEYYSDPGQVVFTTGGAEGFEGFGGSAGLDVTIDPGVQWRTEVRWFSAHELVFPLAAGGFSREAGFLVTALTLRWSLGG